MKSNLNHLFGAAGLTVVLAVSPVFADEQAPETQNQTMQTEVREALAAIKDYSAEQKDAAVAEGERLLDRLDTQMEVLKAESHDAASEAEEKWDASMTRLAELRANADAKLTELKAGTVEVWGDVKRGFSDAIEKLDEALNDIDEGGSAT